MFFVFLIVTFNTFLLLIMLVLLSITMRRCGRMVQQRDAVLQLWSELQQTE